MTKNNYGTPSERLRVFISSAQNEENGFVWLETRRKIRDYLNNYDILNPFIIEDSASSSPSSRFYRRQVANTDVYVLLVKGEVRPGTYDEYRLAKEYNKPMLVYFLEDDNPNFSVNSLKSDIQENDLCTYHPLKDFDHIEEIIYRDLSDDVVRTYQDHRLPPDSYKNPSEPKWVYRVLITDDDIEARENLKKALKAQFDSVNQYEIHVDEVISASEARLKSYDHHYDVYILDVAISDFLKKRISMYQPYGVDLVKAILTDTPNRDVKQRFIIYSKLSREVALKEFDPEAIDLSNEHYSMVYYSKQKIVPRDLVKHLKEYFDEDYSNNHSNQVLTSQNQKSLTASSIMPKETGKDDFYFKISFTCDHGSLFIYSKTPYGANESPKIQITEKIWNNFVECCKDFLTIAFPGVLREHIAITLLSPLGTYSCAPNDGKLYYDEKYRVNFKVSFIRANESQKYDTVHFDIDDNFEVSLFLRGEYSSRYAPDNAPLGYYGINEVALLPTAQRLVCFAMQSEKIQTSSAFRVKFYSDYSGGYILDFIQP